MLKTKSLLLVTLLSISCLAQNSHARLNTLTGGLTVGYDFDETKYERSDEEGTPTVEDSLLKQLSIAPLVLLESSSSTDNLSIRFNPAFTYDQEADENDLDHNFLISAYRDFTNRLRLEISDGFIYSDDPELLEAETTTDYNRGRRRYYTNDFNFNGTYSYAEESSVGAGYSYQILRNDDTGAGGYEDYDRHTADISVLHQFNASWNVDFSGSYTRGLFDPPDPEVVVAVAEGLEEIAPGITEDIDTTNLSNDLSEYRTTTIANWILSPRKTFYLGHSFTGSDYDDALRNNSHLHDFTLGALYQHTRHLSLELSGGPSYEKTETYDANWDYHANFNLHYDIAQSTSIAAGIDKGYDIENFSQNNNSLIRDQGITDFWEAEVEFSHELVNDLTATLFASYRDEDQESILYGISSTDAETLDNEAFREESIFNREIYRAGGTLSYDFLRWYTAAIHYTYRQQDSELVNDSYDEHRVYLTLSFEKELFRW